MAFVRSCTSGYPYEFCALMHRRGVFQYRDISDKASVTIPPPPDEKAACRRQLRSLPLQPLALFALLPAYQCVTGVSNSG